jgi:hypothetical protein
MAKHTCSECSREMEVGFWDDAALSGAVVLTCMDCSDRLPEDVMWDVSKIEEAHEKWPGDRNPNIIDTHPLQESNDAWEIRNRFESKETYLDYLKSSWFGKFPGEENLGHLDWDLDKHEPVWEIFVHDAEDDQAIQEARLALREMQE